MNHPTPASRTSFRRIGVAVVVVMLSLAGGSTRAHRASAASVIAPATLSASSAHVGQAYQVTLAFTAGTTWNVVSGTLPPGLTLTNGRIAGTPSLPGSFSFLVKPGNRSGPVAYKGYPIFVRPPLATGYDSRVHAIIEEFYPRPHPALTACHDQRVH